MTQPNETAGKNPNRLPLAKFSALFVQGVPFAEDPLGGREETPEAHRGCGAPKNFGVIIRTAAMEAKDEDIEHDIQSQIDPQ